MSDVQAFTRRLIQVRAIHRHISPQIILGILSLGFLMTFLDLTVLNVALSEIAKDLEPNIDDLKHKIGHCCVCIIFQTTIRAAG